MVERVDVPYRCRYGCVDKRNAEATQRIGFSASVHGFGTVSFGAVLFLFCCRLWQKSLKQRRNSFFFRKFALYLCL